MIISCKLTSKPDAAKRFFALRSEIFVFCAESDALTSLGLGKGFLEFPGSDLRSGKCQSAGLPYAHEEYKLTFYLIDDLEQGTTEWLDWRRGVIGASDAATIMGENPWGSSQRLMEEKLGLHRPFGGNAATREGHRLEEFARESLEKKYRHKIMPIVVQDSKDPYRAASLDGKDSSSTRIYEIKCGMKSYEMTRNTGAVPAYYVAQLQHMMMVTQLDSLIFAAYRPDERLISFEVERDESYIKRLRKEELNFVKELKSRGHSIQYEFRGYRVH